MSPVFETMIFIALFHSSFNFIIYPFRLCFSFNSFLSYECMFIKNGRKFWCPIRKISINVCLWNYKGIHLFGEVIKKAIIIELVESAILNGNMLLTFKMNVGCSTSKQDRVMVANSNVRDWYNSHMCRIRRVYMVSYCFWVGRYSCRSVDMLGKVVCFDHMLPFIVCRITIFEINI